MATHSSVDRPPPFWGTRYAVGCVVLAAVAAWFLWAEHGAHLLGALPYVLLLACPVMHLFMHRGHREQHRPPGRAGVDDAEDKRGPT